MGFPGKFCSSSSPLKRKINNKSFDYQTDTESINLQIEKMGSIRKSRRKIINNSHQFSSFEDDFNLDKELDMEICLDDHECMWLSSNFASPSKFFAEHRLFGTFLLYVYDLLIS